MAGAGDLRHRVAFDARAVVDDGAGNERGAWQEQFTRRAAFIYAGGGESVMAARLEGRGVLKIRIRSGEEARAIRQDWRMRDTRTAVSYSIREVDADTDRQWVYLVVERGAPA